MSSVRADQIILRYKMQDTLSILVSVAVLCVGHSHGGRLNTWGIPWVMYILWVHIVTIPQNLFNILHLQAIFCLEDIILSAFLQHLCVQSQTFFVFLLLGLYFCPGLSTQCLHLWAEEPNHVVCTGIVVWLMVVDTRETPAGMHCDYVTWIRRIMGYTWLFGFVTYIVTTHRKLLRNFALRMVHLF